MADFRLKVFISVAKNKSFTKAANELHITQPAISKHIRELESAYNIRLIDRSGQNTILTNAGEIFLSHAEKIIDSYNELQFEMNRINNNFVGKLSIGASTTIGQYVIPSLLAQFMKTYPDLKVELINGNSREIEKALLEQRIDIGMVEGIHKEQAIKYTPFLDDEIVLVTRSNSIFGDIESIDISKLLVMPIVLREFGSGSLEVINDCLSKKGISLDNMDILLHLGNSESIKNFLRKSDCVAFISVRAIINELKSGALKIIDIEDLTIERSFKFCTLHGAVNPNVDIFQRFTFDRKSVV